jgi:hypothetical protein
MRSLKRFSNEFVVAEVPTADRPRRNKFPVHNFNINLVPLVLTGFQVSWPTDPN